MCVSRERERERERDKTKNISNVHHYPNKNSSHDLLLVFSSLPIFCPSHVQWKEGSDSAPRHECDGRPRAEWRQGEEGDDHHTPRLQYFDPPSNVARGSDWSVTLH